MIRPKAAPGHRVTRRRLLGHAARAAVAGTAVAAAGAGACSAPSQAAGEDDDTYVARLLAGPNPHLARRDAPYRLTRTVRIPGGVTLRLDPGTQVLWAGPARPPAGTAMLAIFAAGGDGAALVAGEGGGTATVACPGASPFVYAMGIHGHRGVAVRGIQAVECGHVYVHASRPDMPYADVRTAGSGANVARDVEVTGGGARFAERQTTGQGALYLSFVVGARVRDVAYDNAAHGIQWWGGDSGMEPWQNGAFASERKCTGLVIERARVARALGGGIWGSMGRDVVVRDCLVDDALDVGFDAEGCHATLFERCTSRNGRNGCFATFALCDDVRFVDCTGTVDQRAWPLVRIYNVTQSPVDNRRIAVLGGRFTCTDPAGPSTIDAAMGPARDFTIRGASLHNVRIDTLFLNMHRTMIVDNMIRLPAPLGDVPAIRAGGTSAVAGPGGAAVPGALLIRGNRIAYTARTPTRAAAIEVREGDFNMSARGRIEGNMVAGPFAAGVRFVNATANIGIVPHADIADNRFTDMRPGARLLVLDREGPHARMPTASWDDAQTRDGRPVPRAAALAGGG